MMPAFKKSSIQSNWLSVILTIAIVPGWAGAHDGGKDPILGGPDPGNANAFGFMGEGIDVISRLDMEQLAGRNPIVDRNNWGRAVGSDIWGWTDPDTNHEYALMGRSDTLVFVDVTNPASPLNLGLLPSKTLNYWYRDVKTYGNYAFVVADVAGHGMQVFDLTRLRGLQNIPDSHWQEDAYYSEFGEAHNIVINPDSGLTIAVGSDTFNGGLHFMDVSNPLEPKFQGGLNIGYVHDAQAVTYRGPDQGYAGREIVFAYTVDSLTIVDATFPDRSSVVSRTGYPRSQYAHQGWLTEDQRYLLMNDELDEIKNKNKPRTHIWNVESLDSPHYMGFYEFPEAGIDHNLYIKDGLAYSANYLSGLRVLDISDIENANLEEIAWLDTHPNSNAVDFGGVWSSYPFFESGNIILSDISHGLIVARLIEDTLRGDFDSNGQIDANDLQTLAVAIHLNEFETAFDLNSDGVLDSIDFDFWIKEIKQTYYGDSNLDGVFDSTDLIAVFQPGEYEDSKDLNSQWSTGDWNGDLEFDTRDFVTAFQDGGYEKSVHAVPENVIRTPLSLLLVLIIFSRSCTVHGFFRI